MSETFLFLVVSITWAVWFSLYVGCLLSTHLKHYLCRTTLNIDICPTKMRVYLLDRQVTAAAAHKCIHLASRAHHQIRSSMTLMKLWWLISKEASEMGSTNSSSKEWHVAYKIINIWNVMIIEAGKLATQEVCPSDYSVNLNLGGSNLPTPSSYQ